MGAAQSEGLDERGYSLSRTIVRVGEVAGALVAIGGLLGDFLRPLASVNLAMFAGASAVALLLFVLSIRRVKLLGYRLGMSCFFFLILAIGFGLWWTAAELHGDKEKGLVAGNVGIADRIQGAVLDVQRIEGKELAAEIQQKRAAAGRAEDHLGDLLADYPASVLGVTTENGLSLVKSSGTAVTVAYNLRIGVDPAAYDSLADQLVPMLRKEAIRSGETFVISRKVDYEQSADTFDDTLGYVLFSSAYYASDYRLSDMLRFATVYRIDLTGSNGGASREPWWESKVDPESEMVVVVNTARNQQGDRTTWEWFQVPKFKEPPSGMRIMVTFLDSGGREVTKDLITLGPILPGLSADKRRFVDESWNALEMILSPYAVANGKIGGEISLRRNIEMTQSELETVSSVRCSAEVIR